jgi:AraC-like DNA-binding protein
MDGGSPSTHDQELLALRRALLDIAEMAHRTTAQLDAYRQAHGETHALGAGDLVPGTEVMTTTDVVPVMPATPIAAALPIAQPTMGERVNVSRCSLEVSRALQYIEEHFEERVSLERLARVAGCSRSTLTRAFRREVGKTAHDCVLQVKMSRAAFGVAMGTKIEAVMLGLGFRSKRNFYRQFKAHFGCTPAEHRRLHQPS